jgi:hypothetical protein
MRDPHVIPADLFLFPELKISMKGMRFEAVSSVQQTVTRELRRYGKKRFLGHLILCMSDVNVVRKQAGIILSDGINIFLSFLCGFLWPQFGNLLVTLCIQK